MSWQKIKILAKSDTTFKSFRFTAISTISSVASLVTIGLITRNLSKEEFAIYALFLSISGLGISLTLPGFTPILNKLAFQNKLYLVAPIMRKCLKFSILASLLSLIVFFIGPELFESFQRREKIVALAVALYIPLLTMERLDGVLYGLNKFSLIEKLKVANAILNILIVAGAAFYFKDLPSILGAQIIFKLLSTLLLFWAYKYSKEKSSTQELTEEDKHLMKQGRELSWTSIWINFVKNIDHYLLFYLGPAHLANYKASMHFPDKIKDYLKLASQVPVQRWMRTGKEKYIGNMKKYAFLASIFFIIASIIMVVSAPIYIPLIFGDKYEDAVILAQIYGCAIMIRTLGNFLVMIEVHLEDTKYYQKITFYQHLIYLILLFPTVFYFKSIGVVSLILFIDIAIFSFYIWNFKRKKS